MSWTEEYQTYLENPPKPGDILKAYGEEKVALDVDITEGKPPFIYGRAYVPCVVGCPLGWFMQPEGMPQSYGWKCILLPKAREDAIKKLGMKGPLLVNALRVVRVSKSGSSLLCEIAEF